MAERDEHHERTERPSPQKLREARQRGEVARSADLTGVLAALAAVGVLAVLGPALLEAGTAMFQRMLSPGEAARAPHAGLWDPAAPAVALVAALAAAALVAALAVNVLQVGFLVTARPLQPDFGRLSPARGLRRMLSRRSAVRAGSVIVKLLAVGLVAGLSVREELLSLVAASGGGAERIAAVAGAAVRRVALRVGAVLVALAVADYLYQRWQFQRDQRMTHREAREESRKNAVSPVTRQRRQTGRKGVAARARPDTERMEATRG